MKYTKVFNTAVMLVMAFVYAQQSGAATTVVGTKHDLSYGATRTIPYIAKAPLQGGTTQVCIFCHTPHGGNTTAPLWNRADSSATYNVYTSDVLGVLGIAAESPSSGQTAIHVKTRICLSCHDGTIALGSVANVSWALRGGTQIQMKTGYSKLLSSSAGLLGTDLSDDHPVAIKHDTVKDPELQSIPGTAKVRLYGLDTNGRAIATKNDGDYVECTSCHDAHSDQYGNFLIDTNLGSNICTNCHVKQTGGVVGGGTLAHDNATLVGYNPDGAGSLGTTVGQVKCMTCHYTHRSGATGATPPFTANPGFGKYLLSFQEETTCFNVPNRWGQSQNVCHATGASVQTKDIQSQENKSSAHKGGSFLGKHAATEQGIGNTNYGWLGAGATNWHVQCADCHNSHTAGSIYHTPGTNAIVSTSPLYGVGGVSIGYPIGNFASPTQANFSAFESLGVTDSTSMPVNYYEYQICIKCHSSFAWGDNQSNAPVSPSLGGGQRMTNQAQEFNTGNESYHPIAGQKPSQGTLAGGWSTNQTMYCSDCHSSEAGSPKGTHGSNARFGDSPPSTSGFILVSNYTDTYGARGTTFIQPSNDLCFNCHDQNVYQPPAPVSGQTGGTGFRVSGSSLNLHSQHAYVERTGYTTTPSPYPYRCVNCHTRVPHGWKRRGLVVFQNDGFPYETGTGLGLILNTSNIPASPSIYGAAKSDNCYTVNGCHQGP